MFQTDGQPWHDKSPSKWWSRFLRRHGFRLVSLLDLRHDWAYTQLKAGKSIEDVSKQLGHSRISTTAFQYNVNVK